MVLAWKRFVQGRDSAPRDPQALNTSGEGAVGGWWALDSAPLHGVTRWLESPTPNLANQPFSPRFQTTVVVPWSHVVASASSSGGGVVLLVVPYATVDAGWSRQGQPLPQVPPQSHVVNARTNASWVRTNGPFTVRGRTYFVCQQVQFRVGLGGWEVWCERWACRGQGGVGCVWGDGGDVVALVAVLVCIRHVRPPPPPCGLCPTDGVHEPV